MRGRVIRTVTVQVHNGCQFTQHPSPLFQQGALNTPKLLLQSGIGDKSTLESIGIESTLDLPAVGEGLRDHVTYPTFFTLTAEAQAEGYAPDKMWSSTYLDENIETYHASGEGVYTGWACGALSCLTDPNPNPHRAAGDAWHTASGIFQSGTQRPEPEPSADSLG